jgi:OmpA-OmpF porin, OOP family
MKMTLVSMKNKIWLLLFLSIQGVFFCNVLSAQTDKSKKTAEKAPKNIGNIVPNPGFERLATAPIGWFYKGSHFSEVMKYWYSVTTSSPDIYGPQVKVPSDWAEKGFGKQTAHGGKNMIGLTLYGCVNGKPHCREYVQIQLAEPLVVGQWYYAEFWTIHMTKSMQINNLGLLFTKEKLERKTDEILLFKPQIAAPKPIASLGKWMKVSGKFKAREDAEYLCLGNFSDDKNTLAQPSQSNGYNYAYYYLDDILVKKIPPYTNVPVPADDLTKIPINVGDTIRLKNIFFEFDKDELLPRSFVELDKLCKILTKYPKMKIEIIGHTDSHGEEGYNLDLSNRRANAVVTYLVEHKIVAERLRFKGEGELNPTDSNTSETGRANNRRVEFIVLKK